MKQITPKLAVFYLTIIGIIALLLFIFIKSLIKPVITNPNNIPFDSDPNESSLDDINFYQKNPLAKKLPYETEHFTINPPDPNRVYLVELLVSFNAGVNGPPPEEQKKDYDEIVNKYKDEVYNWIRSQGVDPNSVKLKFEY